MATNQCMQMNPIKYLFVVIALLLSVNSSISAQPKAAAPSAAASPARPAVTDARQTKTTATPAVKVRLVDINSAGRNELKTLPGITDAVADKIIASRPFGSKSQLTTRGLLPRDVYENLKGLVMARQDAGTSAQLLNK